MTSNYALEPNKPPSDDSQLTLAYDQPYHWPFMLNFLANRIAPGIEQLENGIYRRRVRYDGLMGVIEVQPCPAEGYCLLRLPSRLSGYQQPIRERVQHLFDLRAKPISIATSLSADEQMAALVKRYPGIRLPGAWDNFKVAVRAILGQQISVKAASTLYQRLIERYSDSTPLPHSTALSRVFPTPARLAQADLTEIGLPKRRAATVQGLAQAVADGTLSLNSTSSLPESLDALTALPGIGPWTANYIALRGLGQADAFLAGDLILRRSASPDPTNPMTERQLEQKSECWRPWRAYAAMLLWADYLYQP